MRLAACIDPVREGFEGRRSGGMTLRYGWCPCHRIIDCSHTIADCSFNHFQRALGPVSKLKRRRGTVSA